MHGNYNEFSLMPEHEQHEVKEAVIQSAARLLLHNWQEVSNLVVDYSPFHRVDSSCEYQKEAENLSCIHLILDVKKDCFTDQERLYIDNALTEVRLGLSTKCKFKSCIIKGKLNSIELGDSIPAENVVIL